MKGLTIVVAGPFDKELSMIRAAAQSAGFRIQEVRTYREVMIQLCREKVLVILCRRNLPDGSWEDVLSGSATHTARPRLIVVANEVDEQLCADVLNLGGFDVLMPMFRAADLCRAIESARRSWWDEVQQEAWRHPLGAATAG